MMSIYIVCTKTICCVTILHQMVIQQTKKSYRHPVKEEGKGMWALAKETKTLDLNSPYFYNQCATHFSKTSLIALHENKVVGFVTGYLIPGKENALFIWQIGVHPTYQGQGIAFSLLKRLLSQDMCVNLSAIHTTITPSNQASSNLFSKLSGWLEAPMTVTPYYESGDFPDGHEAENLIVINLIKN